MEKRTLLAVVLSIVVISGFYIIQGMFFPPPAAVPAEPVTVQAPVEQAPAALPGAASPNEDRPVEDAVPVITGPESEQRVTIDTGLIRVVLTNAGGDVVSYKLREHKDQDDFVEMVLSGSGEAAGGRESHAFTLAFGSLAAEPVSAYFYVNRLSEYSVEFYRDFAVSGDGAGGSLRSNGAPGQFRLTKRYDFRPGEYMFELTVSLDSRGSTPAINFSGAAYTLGFGPQFGPRFEKLDQRYEYRNYYTYINGKRKQEKVNDNGPTVIASRVSWAAIAGKYFTFIAIPDATQYELAFSTKPEPGLPSASRLYMIRPALNGSGATDVYRFYLGPKSQKDLAVYDTAENSFKLRDMQLTSVANTSGFLGPLETLLKWLLMLFYRVIPNYGVAIILLTLLVKVLMFPLTKKGSESTLRMQALSPKIKEIQDKYKDNPTKMNAEMAELYKKEGYNPVAGCLPMILQIPIFFAMYNLFNNHFDLRGSPFIGWIRDLSLPESVWSFAPLRIPILGWSDVRLLPFLYLGSQLLYGKVTQTPDQQGNAQMKMMLYAMPAIFFFILYDVPSGLLLYWIMSNVLTMVQQLTINKYLAQKRAHIAAATPEPVIAPKKKKKR
ncbi:MAG: membrane protein insertase YidC [Spirochaetaceae bacterium]|jgi:YidC/Oxa1 family membrane protein insertase|nr:membrane protein insertase YidC [Spirochaetaceae bacterium]